jgi:hypothetical protein
MMTGHSRHSVVLLALLVALLLIVAGCATVPGPGDRPSPTKTIAVTKTPELTKTTVTPVPPVKTLRTLAPATTTPAAARTVSPGVTDIPATGPAGKYSTETCEELGGSRVGPGESCSGAWLDATDMFSCCSMKAATGLQANLSVVASPLDLRVNFADDPGPIVP